MKFAFKKGTSIMDRIIKFWDRGPYSHVECVLAENADGTFDIASSQIGKGVRVLKKQTLDPKFWDIIECQHADQAQAKAWFDDHAGESYYYLGLVGFVVRPVVGGDRKKWFCSDACMAAAFGMEGSWRITPNGMGDIVKAVSKIP